MDLNDFRVTSSTIVSQSLSLTPMNMNNVSSHVDLSPDTLPISSQTTMIHPRRGTTVLMLAHLSFDLPVPRPASRCRPVLTYRVSSGCDSTVFAPAPLALVRPSNFGACKKQHHVHVATQPRPWSTWWLTVSCSSRPGTSLLFAVRTPKRDPGSANCPLNFELWFLIISLLFDKRLYIYNDFSWWTWMIFHQSFGKCSILTPDSRKQPQTSLESL